MSRVTVLGVLSRIDLRESKHELNLSRAKFCSVLFIFAQTISSLLIFVYFCSLHYYLLNRACCVKTLFKIVFLIRFRICIVTKCLTSVTYYFEFAWHPPNDDYKTNVCNEKHDSSPPVGFINYTNL